MSDRLITVGRFRNLAAAEYYENLLIENGIDAFLPEEYTVATRSPSFWFISLQGRIRLQVPADDAQRALDVLQDAAAYGREVEPLRDDEEWPEMPEEVVATDLSGVRFLAWLAALAVFLLIAYAVIERLYSISAPQQPPHPFVIYNVFGCLYRLRSKQR